ncbi:MAG: zinc metallopeptidase [Vulcanimicrobiota bacterium]
MFYDQTFILLIPAMLLTFFAQWKVKSTFARYAEVPASRRLSGAEAARELARRNRVPVAVEPTPGSLTDHFDPQRDVLALSEPVYHGRSVAALGVAAHELGHALQKANHYWPLKLRSGLVPLANFGNGAGMLLLFGGLFLGIKPLLNLGILIFSAVVLFSLVTLPVEFDASRRALVVLRESGMVTNDEASGVKAVLGAAALTYVASALMAVTHLIRYLLIAQSRD